MVGGHFDYSRHGDGVADNWSGAAIAAMVNVDTIGLSAPTIWTSRTDKRLASLYGG